MLLVHQTGSVKVGEVVRYTLTYTPSADRILPSPTHLHVKIKNTSAIALRAAYLHGPYALHAAAYPSTFNPNDKTRNPRKEGVPQFDPNVKAGGSFAARIPVPEEIRVLGQAPEPIGVVNGIGDEKAGTVTWIIEIASQILFSASASVNFEVLVSRDERSLEYNFAADGNSQGHSERGRVHDHQQGRRKQGQSAQPKGVYSKAIMLVVDDTTSLWNKPELPISVRRPSMMARVSGDPQRAPLAKKEPREEGKYLRRLSLMSGDARRLTEDTSKIKPRKKRKIHLVILTHGLHSNLGADMLYLKESIDATAKHARESARQRRKAAAGRKTSGGKESEDPSTAPLSGGQEDIHDGRGEESEDDDEEIIVRGFNGNAVRTENGIQYLGKRLAKWVLDITYPDQPYKPVRKSMTKKFSDSLSSKTSPDREHGIPTHSGSTVRLEDPEIKNLAYTFTSISFIGHSLGGLVQLYAIGYIQKHAPKFFEQIQPVNFVAMASPLLGLSNENPMYVKFALDFGLVGRTGQDLGLTWRPPTLARSGWTAVVGGLGGGKDHAQEDPGAKPLLRILPTGPAHRVLRMFRNRTLYSNVVNDGIVPLRTSCLLFLDWKGLGKVEKARRENGLIGTMAGWGWAEITGQSASPNPSKLTPHDDIESLTDSDAPEQSGDASVPQPSDDATNDDGAIGPPISPIAEDQALHLHHHSAKDDRPTANEVTSHAGIFDGLLNFFRPKGKTTKNDLKMFKRSQTIMMDDDDAVTTKLQSTESSPNPNESDNKRPPATRGDSILGDPSNALAPPKTTIFESAGDILNPPIPPASWIIDPSSRTRTIFHDRVYHPEDIPAPPGSKSDSKEVRTGTGGDVQQASSNPASPSIDSNPAFDQSHMRVEEKIARAYHKDLSWRKVLVRLEPDAHNNMIVRRMFANAYGWPVVKHLCDTHFGDTYAARTRDEDEPASDRAKALNHPVSEHGEQVKGQGDVKSPALPATEMREVSDELAPLRSSEHSSRRASTTHPAGRPESGVDSWDEAYFQDTTTDDEAEAKGPAQRFWSPPALFKGQEKDRGATSQPSLSGAQPEEHYNGTSQADIADFLNPGPAPMDGHRGLEATPILPARSPTALGLNISADIMATDSSTEEHRQSSESGVGEHVAKSISNNSS